MPGVMVRRVLSLGAAALAALGLAVGTAAAPALATSTAGPPPTSYYLSLGDSLGFGFQQLKIADVATQGAAAWTTGYTDDLAATLARTGRPLTVTNYSCPGETTTSMIAGGCSWTRSGLPLHDPYSGPQLDAAVAFLAAHPGHVPLITLSIGANDVLKGYPACLATNTCPELAPELATLRANLATVLDRLHQASPSSKVVVLSIYDPFGVAYPESKTLAVQVDATIAATALTHHARVADAFVPFNVLPRPGLCALTYFCSTGSDIHPTDQGYRTIASAFYLAQLF
ncbi:SGNH/GDSL hydrolase family protein [Luteimicrobium subarcticum]|uniref:GDSL-like lipase/acylhydrolase family protein n=1 Tax=Luteimicrobium subarcticum TaxID=620910 RepID=A0A2M8WRN2_9MICO|nr:SGNH/GDSL hydrolase family protein [Luteimicrobium subarcticum]PJI93591.1 GDSL-like lipase/acylhydrolase family protein [Luteimicrobium subarcticum]